MHNPKAGKKLFKLFHRREAILQDIDKYDGIFHIFRGGVVDVNKEGEIYRYLSTHGGFSQLEQNRHIIEGHSDSSPSYYLSQIEEGVQKLGVPKAILFTNCPYDIERVILDYADRLKIPAFEIDTKVHIMDSPERTEEIQNAVT